MADSLLMESQEFQYPLWLLFALYNLLCIAKLFLDYSVPLGDLLGLHFDRSRLASNILPQRANHIRYLSSALNSQLHAKTKQLV